MAARASATPAARTFSPYDGTPLVVAITITGDAVCRATNVVYRLDTESARQFLAPFVTLP